MNKNKLRVVFVAPATPHYREKFYENVRLILDNNGINFELIYSDPFGYYYGKGDSIELNWAKKVKVFKIGMFGKFIYIQNVFGVVGRAHLTIIVQENALIANYILILFSKFSGARLALFGHGKNFQAKNPGSLAERWKKVWSNWVYWWFPYTERCAEIVRANGFPANKITVFNNSIDLDGIKSDIEKINSCRIHSLRETLFDGSQNIAVYVGGLYKEKRVDFMISAAIAIRSKVRDFRFCVIGGGDQRKVVEEASIEHPWIRYMGPKFGVEKAELVSMSRLWLNPGLVGLSVLDTFAYGVPMVTTNVSYHSPEFAYLENNVNGIVVDDANCVNTYAEAVVALLRDEVMRERIAHNARMSAADYSIGRMAELFSEGVLKAVG